ncbi:similar to An12g09970 [Aspergillus luchuensis]|uniref:Similar to An12g09970 n=1 Tax=Aspergillus kawachii TaxID=1069201 RepID=A0A146F3C7_ASPKA|nr:similar to An12g09970 [Aspergillus luchuensis]
MAGMLYSAGYTDQVRMAKLSGIPFRAGKRLFKRLGTTSCKSLDLGAPDSSLPPAPQ